MGYPPVVVVESGGVPRTQVAEGVSAPAYTVVESGARAITLADNAPPIALFNEDGTPYTGGGGDAPSLATGFTWAWGGDGLVATAGGVGSGTNNPPHQFQRILGGNGQPCPVPNIGKSGTTIKTDIASNKAFIYPYVIDVMAAQCPDLFVLGTIGANDNLLSTNPGANPASGHTTNPYLQDCYDAWDYAYEKFDAYGGSILALVETAGSAKAGEATYAATVRQAMSDHVAAMTALDPRVIYCSLADMTPASDFSIESGGQYVHGDERYGYFVAYRVFTTAVAPFITLKTTDEIIDMIDAGTYPLMSGGNLDASTNLSASGGTITGSQGMSGAIAAGKTISNTTGMTGVVVSTALAGSKYEIIADFAAATAATGDGKVMIQDTSSISVTATPGQVIRTGFHVKGSAGFRNFGSEWNNNFGFWGGGATSIANNSLQGANETHELDSLIFNNMLGTSVQTFGNSTTYTGRRSFALFHKSGSTFAGTMKMRRPFTYKLSNRTRTTMAYIGDIKDSTVGGGYMFSGTSGGSRMRPSGTISNAAGGTLRVEPGSWNMFGLTEADFAERRFYKGGSAGQAGVGTGTLLGSAMSGSTWTQTYGAGAVTAADLIYVEITDRDGVIWRSTATVTAT